MSTPIRTLIDKKTLDGKKVVIFTTTNISAKEYEAKNKPLAWHSPAVNILAIACIGIFYGVWLSPSTAINVSRSLFQ